MSVALTRDKNKEVFFYIPLKNLIEEKDAHNRSSAGTFRKLAECGAPLHTDAGKRRRGKSPIPCLLYTSRNAVCWKIQSVPVAENVYGLNHIVIIKKRFAHAHIDDACDFSAKQNDLLYNL